MYRLLYCSISVSEIVLCITSSLLEVRLLLWFAGDELGSWQLDFCTALSWYSFVIVEFDFLYSRPSVSIFYIAPVVGYTCLEKQCYG